MKERRLLPKAISTLNKIAESCLDINYEDLKSFYQEIMFNSNNYDYIVFIVRRSLILAEMFFLILKDEYKDDKEKSKLIKAAKSKFCTDGRLTSLSKDLSAMYIKDISPKILLVDELLIQGKSLNKIMDKLIEDVYNDIGEVMEQSIVKSLVIDSVDISVFARNNDTFRLRISYQKNFRSKKVMVDAKWHYLSNCITILINNINLSNLSFIAPAFVNKSKLDLKDIPGFKKYHTNSYDLEETVYIHKNTLGKLVATVRVIYYEHTKCYEFLPFVFLPDLKITDVDSVIEQFKNNKDFDADLYEKFSDRTKYELICLYINKLLLDCFISNFGNEDEFRIDFFKLQANYGFKDKYLKSLLIDNNTDEMTFESLINDITKNTQSNFFSEIELAKDNVLNFEEGLITKSIEDKIYITKLKDFQDTFKNNKFLFKSNTNLSQSMDICDLYSSCVDQNSGISFFAWLLQYMDRGIVTLKVDKKDEVYCQYLNTGEVALTIYPKRYIEYIPSLVSIKQVVGNNYFNLKREINRFVDVLKQNNVKCDDYEALSLELYSFIVYLDKTNQTIKSWDINLNKNYIYTQRNEKIRNNRQDYAEYYLGLK